MKKMDISFGNKWLVFLYLSLVFGNSAFAGSPEPSNRIVSFDLPAQSLQSGLVEFALQAGISIVVDNEVIKGHYASPLAGPHSLERGLSSLLAGTSLGYSYQTTTGTYVIHKKVVVAKPTQDTLPVEPAQPDLIEELVITGTSLPFRYHTVANSQIDGGIAYFDSSRFINILPQQLFKDQRPGELIDVLKYASGITPGDGLADTNDDVFIRGFQRHAIYLDGLRLSDGLGVKLSPANIEQVEILKGPSTLLYGQAEPGGIINVVRKAPKDESFFRMGVGAGSFGQRSVDGDFNVADALVDKVNTRLVLSLNEQAEAGEINNIHRELIAPSASWQLSNNTRIDLGYEYQFSRQEALRDFTVLNPSGPFPGATMEQLTAQKRPEFSSEFNLYHAQLNHYFSDQWRFSAKYFLAQEDRLGIRTSGKILTTTDVLLDREEFGNDFYVLTMGGQLAVPLIFHPQTQDMYFSLGNIRSLFDEEGEEFINNARFALDGTFDTGLFTHHINLGADWYRQDIYKKYLIEKRSLLPGRTWAPYELDQAFFEIIDALMSPTQMRGITSQEQRLLYDDLGFFIQDNIALGEKWNLTFGTRYSNIQGDYTDISKSEFTQLQTHNRFSSQLGLVFKPNENHSVFINYSESLRANYHIYDIGSLAVAPELSNQFEVGLKSQLLNGRLLSSIALFDIDKNNIVDLKIIEGYRTSLQAHQQNTRGLDMDVTLQVSPDLNIMGALSLIDPQIMSGENQGKVPDMAAKKTASLFAHYRLMDNLELSGGFSYIGERITYGMGTGLDGEGSNSEYFILNAYTTVDLGLIYHFDAFGSANQFQLLVTNLFDEYYYTSILGGTRFNPAEGRSISGRIGFEF